MNRDTAIRYTCPHCQAPGGIYCTRPRHLNRRPRVIQGVHRPRVALAVEMERLRARVERRQSAYLWDQKYFVTPRLVDQVFGDGKKIIHLAGINTRPAYWVVRIDSQWSTSNYDPSPCLRDWLEEIYQAIEGQFGTGEKEDGSLYARSKFPSACNLGAGCAWGEFSSDETTRLLAVS